jgi:geranylgeranyl diphosphate synthase, type II
VATADGSAVPVARLQDYLSDCRRWILAELEQLVPAEARYRRVLYDYVFDYPLRDAKALRPSLCVATCRALGGSLHGVLPSATALELYHNAFLLHDDVEDGSEMRRSAPTMHVAHGVPIAINTGDAMLALALEPLLRNVEHVGLGKALRILECIARMARETAEGQALELHWVRHVDWQLTDNDYLEMVMKKTCWYSFIAPLSIGAIVAGARQDQLAGLRALGAELGVGFQLQDDVLNLVPAERYGKESCGDLWEGKHTLILIHAVRNARDDERQRAIEVLRKRRPNQAHITDGRQEFKTEEDVAFLLSLIDRYASLDYARRHARDRAARARTLFGSILGGSPRSVHWDFLSSLIDFVVDRTW